MKKKKKKMKKTEIDGEDKEEEKDIFFCKLIFFLAKQCDIPTFCTQFLNFNPAHSTMFKV